MSKSSRRAMQATVAPITATVTEVTETPITETETPITETETATPTPAVVQFSGNITNPNSIRQIICTGLLSGKSTAEITVLVKTAHPNSAAASKAVKHIGWYRSDLRKRGLLPKYTPNQQATVATTTAVTA